MSTPRTLHLPDGARRVTIETSRGAFAALEALPATGVCERTPALLVPGYTGSKEDFLAVIGLLAGAGRRVVAIDMRGQFETPGAADADAYSLAALAADVAVIADAVAARDGQAGDQVHLMGHSLGGLVAREVVLAGAARTRSLTLMSSGPGALTGPRAVELRAVLAVLDGLPVAELGGQVKSLWDAELEPAAVADSTAPGVVEFLRTRMLANCALGLRAMGQILLTCPDRTERLRQATAGPLLVIYGENDDAWAPELQETMAETLRAERVCIPGAVHSPAVEAPETTASTLTRFWNAAEARARRSQSVSG